jgi:hypothetical protein
MKKIKMHTFFQSTARKKLETNQFYGLLLTRSPGATQGTANCFEESIGFGPQPRHVGGWDELGSVSSFDFLKELHGFIEIITIQRCRGPLNFSGEGVADRH